MGRSAHRKVVNTFMQGLQRNGAPSFVTAWDTRFSEHGRLPKIHHIRMTHHYLLNHHIKIRDTIFISFQTISIFVSTGSLPCGSLSSDRSIFLNNYDLPDRRWAGGGRHTQFHPLRKR